MRYSIKKHGRNYKLSDHFTLGEMACKDGSDVVLVSPDLIAKLEALRSYVGGSVVINSGYRTAAYNKKIGGAANSQHTKGTAADIVVKKDGAVVPAKLICCLCQTLGFKGIGFISNTATHVDMRASGSYRGDERQGYGGNVGGDFYRYFGISKAQVEALKSIKEEEDMTQDQFNRMADAYFAAKAKKEPGTWSKEARAWAEKNGIIKGTGNGKEYQSYCTREQMAAMLHRLAKLLRG